MFRKIVFFKETLLRICVFALVLSLNFSPFSELVNSYSQRHLPNYTADLIAKVVPRTNIAKAATNGDVYVFITVASASQLSNLWLVPDDWNSASNSIEVIGGGGTGGDGTTGAGAGGGGGGGYSRINNIVLSPGDTAYFSVGASGSQPSSGQAGGDGGHTWFGTSGNSTYAQCFSTGPTGCVSAEGGEGGNGSSSSPARAGGLGGGTSSASWSVAYSGGEGGDGSTSDGSGGGGGAAGPHSTDGNGENGGNGSSAEGGGGGGGGGGSATAGSNADSPNANQGGNGGHGYGGSGGGDGAATPANGADGTASGAGGGGGDQTTSSSGTNGGAGAAGQQWLGLYGSGGGGGGAGDSGASGGKGGGYGGGGGGAATNTSGTNGKGANGLIVIKYRPLATQTHFQWFNDNYALDSMDNLASISAEDMMASGSEALTIDTTYRLRFQIVNQENYNGSAFINHSYRLEMTKASASLTCQEPSDGWQWRTVPITATTASDAFNIENSSQFSDGASTSLSLLSTPAGATTFTNGYGLDVRATSGYQTIADDAYTEIEWALKPNSNAGTSSNYCFRTGWVIDTSTVPDTLSSMSYLIIASASVQATPGDPTFTQNDYQWFSTAADVQPGSSLAAENQNVEIVTSSVITRLRMNITVGAANLSATSKQFKLQYASGSSGPWADVGGASAKWQFHDAAPADGADITTVLLSSSEQSARQTYEDDNPSVTNPRSVTIGQDMEYDWSLDPVYAVTGRIYYFRMVESDDTEFLSYNNYPTLRIMVDTSNAGGGGGPSGVSGGSGGGNPEGGGGQGGGGSGSGGQGGSGGGGQEGGGGQGGGGGGSPAIFDWRLWFDTRFLGKHF